MTGWPNVGQEPIINNRSKSKNARDVPSIEGKEGAILVSIKNWDLVNCLKLLHYFHSQTFFVNHD